MSRRTAPRLTSRQRLTRGLTYSAIGPVDVTRGVLGLGAHSAAAGAASLRRRYRAGRDVGDIIAAPPEVVVGLPQVLQDAHRPGRGRRGWVIAGVAVAVLGGGAVAFAIVRRASQPDPQSPRPPSVDVHPKP